MRNGKLNCKVRLRKDVVRLDGKYSVFIQVILNRSIKRISLGISVLEKEFDEVKQRVKSSNEYYKDYNLLIEKKLADINTIEVNYRLTNKFITLQQLTEELNNPTARVDFIKFWENEMDRQKEILKASTFRQQMTMLNKLKAFKNPLFFYEINEDFIVDLKVHCKRKLKNNDNTVSSLIKSFKKYIHIANKKGIVTPVNFSDIKNKSFKGNRTYLNPEEIKILDEYWESKFINDTHKKILTKFLTSCFTGVRYSDIMSMKEENFLESTFVFTAEKTKKFQRIPLNKSALKYINSGCFFDDNFTNEYTNRTLKEICKIVGIRKKVSYHVSRHTFATNFLICGGRVEHLQKLLGHSKIEETMIYVHIVEQISGMQIKNMDEILI
jgi:site-specific recombinase XerD